MDKIGHIDLFNGYRFSPLPMEFGEEMTQTKAFYHMQQVLNNLIDFINELEQKNNNYTDNQIEILREAFYKKVSDLQQLLANSIIEMNTNIEKSKKENKEYIEEKLTKYVDDMEQAIHSLAESMDKKIDDNKTLLLDTLHTEIKNLRNELVDMYGTKSIMQGKTVTNSEALHEVDEYYLKNPFPSKLSFEHFPPELVTIDYLDFLFNNVTFKSGNQMTCLDIDNKLTSIFSDIRNNWGDEFLFRLVHVPFLKVLHQTFLTSFFSDTTLVNDNGIYYDYKIIDGKVVPTKENDNYKNFLNKNLVYASLENWKVNASPKTTGTATVTADKTSSGEDCLCFTVNSANSWNYVYFYAPIMNKKLDTKKTYTVSFDMFTNADSEFHVGLCDKDGSKLVLSSGNIMVNDKYNKGRWVTISFDDTINNSGNWDLNSLYFVFYKLVSDGTYYFKNITLTEKE